MLDYRVRVREWLSRAADKRDTETVAWDEMDVEGHPELTYGDVRSLLSEIERKDEALRKIAEHDGISYRFGDEVRAIARAALSSKVGGE